jgi:hypothetical protein
VTQSLPGANAGLGAGPACFYRAQPGHCQLCLRSNSQSSL